MIYDDITKKIKESNRIAIMSHIMPDGDSIGSSLALCSALKKFGKEVSFILDDSIPKIYKFLEGSGEVRSPEENKSFDAVIVLDCGDAERLGKSRLYLEDNFVINIDHHISNNNFGNLNLVDANVSATGEIVYRIIKELGIDMDKGISECIYTAIVTDTGQFQYSNTTAVTHRIAGDLINNGVSVPFIFEKIYQNSSKGKVFLMKAALNSLEFYYNDSIACISITTEQMKEANAKDEDSEGIINLVRDIECVEVAVFLKELEPNKIKVGLRSKKVIDVAAIALRFGGGGHVRSAGCMLDETVSEVKEKVIDAIIAEYQKH